jgi:hypothetical protein
MPAKQYAATRTATRSDGIHIGKAIREIVRLIVHEGMLWYKAADQVGFDRARADRALHKPHVIAYRREQRKRFNDFLNATVPHRLGELMYSENDAAAVRACLAVNELAAESNAEPARRIQTGGIVIVLGANAQRALPVQAPALELQRIEEETDG